MNDQTLPIIFYLVYLVVSITLVVWLARILFRAGTSVLTDVFGSEEMAGAVNRMLVVGFYLLNMGYAFLLFQLEPDYAGPIEAWNHLVNRLGVLLLSLGAIHLLNMVVLWRVRTARSRRNALPVPPTTTTASTLAPVQP